MCPGSRRDKVTSPAWFLADGVRRGCRWDVEVLFLWRLVGLVFREMKRMKCLFHGNCQKMCLRPGNHAGKSGNRGRLVRVVRNPSCRRFGLWTDG